MEARTLGQSMRKALLPLLMATALAVGVAPASLAEPVAEPVANLQATPKAPKKVEISWDAYSGFPVAHYEVTLDPGSRFQAASSTSTSVIFDDLNWGVSYEATVVAVGTSEGERSPVSELSVPGAKLTADVVTSPVFRGQRLNFVGELTRSGGQPIAGGTVKIQVDLSGSPVSYTTLATRTTSSSGEFSFRTRAKRNATYRFLYQEVGTAGGWAYAQARVKSRIGLNISPNPAAKGSRVRFTGTVKAPASLVQGERIELQRLRKGEWTAVRASQVASDATYSFSRRMRISGISRWRVVLPSYQHFVTSASRSASLTVR